MTWYQIIEYCNWMSTKDGLELAYSYNRNRGGEIVDVHWNLKANGYRLPTEAEWELASGISTATVTEEDYIKISGVAQKRIFNAMPYNVRQKKANKFGIFDMFGIVVQYCWDYYHEDYFLKNENNNPLGPTTFYASDSEDLFEEVRVTRGSTWFAIAEWLVQTPRNYGYARWNTGSIGFRLAKNR